MCWLPPGHVLKTEDLDNFTPTSSHLFLPQTCKAPGGNVASAPHCKNNAYISPFRQCHWRFPKFFAETFGLFPADCFSGCWLGEICRLPMLRGPSGYSQPCAGAAFLSAHSLCRGSAQDTPAASAAAPLSSRNCTLGSRPMCSGCRETQTRCLNINYTGSARLQLECGNAFPHPYAACPRTAQMEQQEPTLCWEQDAHQGDRESLRSFPSFLSQPWKMILLPTSMGRTWNGDPCSTGRELTIYTDGFFPSFYLRWATGLFPSLCFHGRLGCAPRGSAQRWARSCSLQRMDRRTATLLRHQCQVRKVPEFHWM